MIRGNEILRELASRRTAVEAEIRKYGGKISELESDLRALFSKEVALWNEFASIQLGEGVSIPAQVEAVLRKREERIEAEKENVRKAEGKIKLLQPERKKLADAVAARQQALGEAEGKAEKVFQSSEEVRSLMRKAAGYREALESLEEKLRRAVDELKEKSPSYEKDEFFTYLRSRGFGTPDYRGWGIAARLDSWLARAARYQQQSRDYDRLRSIPGWIASRKENVEKDLSETEGRLDAIRRDAYKGTAPLLEDLKRTAADLESLDGRIAEAERSIHDASSYIASAAHASDVEMKRATKLFAEILSSKGMRSIAEAAARTSSKEDDEIVARLQSLKTRQDEISAEIESMKPGLEEYERRARAIRDVESKLRSRGWTRHADQFRDGRLRNSLDELASGMINASTMWHILDYSHRREQPTSYSSGYGSGAATGGWSDMGFGGSSGSFGDSSGGFGGGSWSSGGGFGGDSSSTGGGF